jgi:hypothetical protein
MPFRLVNGISDQSKALSLEFANSAFGLKQCKFAISGTLLSPRLVIKDFVKSLKVISPAWKKLLHQEKGDAYGEMLTDWLIFFYLLCYKFKLYILILDKKRLHS